MKQNKNSKLSGCVSFCHRFKRVHYNCTVLYICYRTDEDWTVTTNPSKPMYFRYTFPSNINSVVVHLQADDDLCMVFSVQDIHVCIGHSMCVVFSV